MSTLTVNRDLDEMRTWARARISEAAENLRLFYITPGSGKAMVYTEKAKEAQTVQDHLVPATLDPDDFPMLQSEIAVQGGDLESAAATIAARAAEWRQIAKAIEVLEGAAKRDVLASGSSKEIEDLAASVTATALAAAIA